MKLNDIFKLSLNSLTHRGLRSWLTILGIIVGIAAVVTMLSIGEGMQQSIEQQLSGLGTDIITVSPGYTKAEGAGGGFGRRPPPGGSSDNSDEEDPLTDDDIDAISGVDGVVYVNGIVSGRGEVSYLSETVTLSIEGINPSVWSEMTTSELDSGRFIDQGEDSGIVIGSCVASDVFDRALVVNTQIEIEEKSFKIIGILQESGMGSFGGDDRTIFMSNDAAREILADFEDDEYSSMELKVSDTEDVDKITDDIENALFSSRGIYDESDQDFTVTSQASMAETVTSTIESVTMFIVAIAAISLIVGAIGIANTMFMSVMERTKLIGILKSLGTKNSEIMKLYLIESAIIGFTGGVMGVFLGLILTGFVNEIGISIAGSGSLSAIVTLDLIPLSLAFSTFIGVISGLIPAKRAASLQIVEAMRSGE